MAVRVGAGTIMLPWIEALKAGGPWTPGPTNPVAPLTVGTWVAGFTCVFPWGKGPDIQLHLWEEAPHPRSPGGLFLVPDPQCNLGSCFTQEGPTLLHHGASHPAFALMSRLNPQVQLN